MQVTISANLYREQRGYEGADLSLPASRFAIADALQRAQILEEDRYGLCRFEGWPAFLYPLLRLSGEKTLEELNLLAYKVGRLDETQLGIYEGILKLRQDGDIDTPVSMRELINAAYNLDSFEFHPGVTNDYDLGAICLQGEMLNLIEGLPDDVYELLDEEKVGQALRRSDQGTFTPNGYVYRSSPDRQETYDGVRLPEQPDSHSGLISIRMESVGRGPDENSVVWIELPADEQAMHRVLASLGKMTFDTCLIAEVQSIIPMLIYQLAGDEEIGKLNTLAERLQAFPDSRTLAKYKALLELEVCSSLDMELDIANNLGCYVYDPIISSPAAYAEYLLKKAGINTDDPAFSCFDFRGFGERQSSDSGLVYTAYGSIARNEEPFVQEYTKPQTGITMQ